MTSPASPYIAPEASDKKWWDPFGLFASKPAPSNPPSDFTPSATAGRRRRGGKPSVNAVKKPVTAKSQLNSQRAMIKLAVKNSMKQKAAKGGRRSRTKKHSRK